MTLREPAAALLAAALSATPVPPRTLAEGGWGGDHVGATVSGNGVRFELDCAHASIEGPVALDAEGRFDVRGIYAKESPGPVRPDTANGQPARFRGRIEGEAMSLDIVLTGSGEDVGSFALRKDRLPRIRKCG